MRRIWGISFLAACLLLSGCSGLKNIQDLTYIVALGMDYDEETKEYTAYLQGLNFANVAKSEGGKPVEPVPIFIASATGETLNLAVSKLYNKSEPPLFFGHVSTMVLSKSIVTHRFNEVIEEIGRNRSLRHTLRVIATEEDIQEVLNIKALFNYPAVYTVLFKKNEKEMYQDEIKPMTLMDFLRDFYEPMGMAKLPSVKIDQDTWKADKDYPILFFDGYEIFQQQKFMDSLPMNDAIFINWLLGKTVSINRKIEEEGELLATIKLASPKMKVKYEKKTDSPKFSIEISVRADLLEQIKDVPLKKLESLMEEEIKTDLKKIYYEGVENKTDLLNVGEKWYRYHPKYYKKLKNSKTFYLDKDSVKSVKVKVEVFHFNSYKYDREGQ